MKETFENLFSFIKYDDLPDWQKLAYEEELAKSLGEHCRQCDLKEIVKSVSFKDRTLQLAEECNELSQAILKYHRFLKGTNPTNKSLEEVYNDLAEEIADVCLCLDTVLLGEEKLTNNVDKWYYGKLDRWVSRLKERSN